MIPLRLLRPTTALLTSFVVLVAVAQVPPILARARKASRELSYSAIRVTMVNGKPTTERVFASRDLHRIDRNNLTIIENGKERFVFDRQANTLRRTEMFDMLRRPGPPRLTPPGDKAGAPKPPKGLEGSFQVVDGGSVAGRRTQLVRYVPKAAGKTGGQYWIDSATGLILKSQMPAMGKRPAIDFEFTAITYAEQPRSLFTADFPGATLVDPRTDLVKYSRELDLPAFTMRDGNGYSLSRTEKKKIGDRQVIQQSFRGDKKFVSLFITTGPVSETNLAKNLKNGSVLSWQQSGYTLILLGNVSATELQILKSRVGAA